MISKFEVQLFLNQFKDKMKIWNVVFMDNRTKNFECLAELDITPVERIKILQQLEVIEYSEGPIEDKLADIANLWVFGKQVKGKEIYIKISMGYPGSSTICISFHIAEYAMKYPFK